MNKELKKWLVWVKDPLTVLGIILVGAVIAGSVILFQQKTTVKAQLGSIEENITVTEEQLTADATTGPATIIGRVFLDNVPYSTYNATGATPDAPMPNIKIQVSTEPSFANKTTLTTDGDGNYTFSTPDLTAPTVYYLDIETDLASFGYNQSAGPMELPIALTLNAGQTQSSEDLVSFGYTLVPPGFFQTRRGDVHTNEYIRNYYPGLQCIKETDGTFNIDSADTACSAEFLVTAQEKIFNFFTRSQLENNEDWVWGDDKDATGAVITDGDSYYDLGRPFVNMSPGLKAPNVAALKMSVPADCQNDALETEFSSIDFKGTEDSNHPVSGCPFYLVKGDLTLAGTPTIVYGRGTIIVEGDLIITGNVQYNRQNYYDIFDLDSLGMIVEGDVVIKPEVDRVVGAFYVGSAIYTNNNAQ